MSDNNKTPEDGNALWQWFTRDIVPLGTKKNKAKHVPQPPSASKPPKELTKPHTHIPKTTAATKKPLRPQNTGTQLDRRTNERLRKGQIPIEAVIDLHGMSQEQAHAALSRFIQNAHRNEKRCLLVITGKGQHKRDPLAPHKGILKNRLPQWLDESPLKELVLKHYPAKPKDGGSGAFYIYLRRKR